MQRLDSLRVTHQSQVTRRGLSYEAVFFSSATVTGETSHCAKMFTVIQEERPDEGLFDKDPDPPPPEIQNSAALPSSPGGANEAGVFNASYQAEDIALVRNKGLEVDDDKEPAPKNVPLVYTPDSDTLFELQTWGWDDIDRRSVLAQNHNEPSFKNVWIPQNLYYIDILLHCLPLKWLIIVLLPINFQGYEGGRYFSVYTRRSTTLFRPMDFNVHLLWMEEGWFLECQIL